MTSRLIVTFLMCSSCAVVGQTSPTAPAEPPDACALLSRLDVQDAAGIPVGAGVSRLRTATLTSCSFAGERGGRLAVLVRTAPTGDWVSEQAGRMKRGIRFGTYREVPGIGDRSFLYDMRGAGGVLCVFGAGYYLQVSLFRLGEESRISAALEKLARSALARLRSCSYRSLNTLVDNGACRTCCGDAI